MHQQQQLEELLEHLPTQRGVMSSRMIAALGAVSCLPF